MRNGPVRALDQSLLRKEKGAPSEEKLETRFRATEPAYIMRFNKEKTTLKKLQRGGGGM